MSSKLQENSRKEKRLYFIGRIRFNEIVDIVNSNKEGGEKEALILARLGQGRFKNSLIKKGEGCAISGYLNKDLLIASHIKPWSKCDNFEKVDPNNGLLLLPNFDKLFDKGLISFDDHGHVLISDLFTDAEIFVIKKSLKIRFRDGSKKYMEYHRLTVFKKDHK
ncbi:HNH endonuclease signature motif containing protein [Sphingobacterium sp. G1-14]|uniref:HNH endonuclease n=1 Tax=Sphingobacterium sp. G1-14 TaxID=2003121 RepID=UPI000B48C25C